MGKILAVCISAEKGTQKHNVGRGTFRVDHGIVGDSHAGNWHRQVSLLSADQIESFKTRGEAVIEDGAFGENLVVAGIDLARLPIGTVLKCNDVLLEVTQIGKECHHHCQIRTIMGDCIMPREGIFAKVIQPGEISSGDEITVLVDQQPNGYRAAIITASDKGASGQREDQSGAVIREMLQEEGYVICSQVVLPDEREQLAQAMRELCDQGTVDLIITTGGTGFSPRDCTPEATLDVLERQAPGIVEAMRWYSLQITKRAMLSRAVAGIRGRTLIINLPGSPKAVKENLAVVLPELAHGLEVLRGDVGDCARER